MIKFTEEQIEANYNRFMQIIEDSFPEERAEKLKKMYEHFADRLYTAPASGYAHFHLATVGGYLQHVLNIIDTSAKVKELYESMGGKIDFTDEERIFAAMHHDLGKLGDVDEDYYVFETSEWHRENQGRYYKSNPKLKLMTTVDRSFFILQHFGITYTQNEMLGIRLADGAFDNVNAPYFENFSADKQFKTNIQFIIHWADWMTTRLEVDQWRESGKKEVAKLKENLAQPNAEVKKQAKTNPMKAFNELFKDD